MRDCADRARAGAPPTLPCSTSASREIVVIAVVALIVIGPERLPKAARTLGHLFGRLQRYVNDVKADINREIELDELRKLQSRKCRPPRATSSRPSRAPRAASESACPQRRANELNAGAMPRTAPDRRRPMARRPRACAEPAPLPQRARRRTRRRRRAGRKSVAAAVAARSSTAISPCPDDDRAGRNNRERRKPSYRTWSSCARG